MVLVLVVAVVELERVDVGLVGLMRLVGLMMLHRQECYLHGIEHFFPARR